MVSAVHCYGNWCSTRLCHHAARHVEYRLAESYFNWSSNWSNLLWIVRSDKSTSGQSIGPGTGRNSYLRHKKDPVAGVFLYLSCLKNCA